MNFSLIHQKCNKREVKMFKPKGVMFLTLVISLMVIVPLVDAQEPTRSEQEAMYYKYLNFASYVKGGSIQPHWMADGSSFWYAEGAPANTVIYKIDPKANTKTPLFNTEQLRQALTAVLEAHDYNVVSARDGEEGLAKLREEKPDLMILDLLMPRMDGFAVCKELLDGRWAKYRDIPIVVLTSVREDAGRRRYKLETGLQLNVDDYVEKPIDPHTLLYRVEKAIKRKG